MARQRKEKVSQKEAEKMVESGEATIPAEAIVSTEKSPYQEHMAGWESKKEKAKKEKAESSQIEKDYQMHPKFSKFKGEG